MLRKAYFWPPWMLLFKSKPISDILKNAVRLHKIEKYYRNICWKRGGSNKYIIFFLVAGLNEKVQISTLKWVKGNNTNSLTIFVKLLCRDKTRWLCLADFTWEMVHISDKCISCEESYEFLGHDIKLNWVWCFLLHSIHSYKWNRY